MQLGSLVPVYWSLIMAIVEDRWGARGLADKGHGQPKRRQLGGWGQEEETGDDAQLDT